MRLKVSPMLRSLTGILALTILVLSGCESGTSSQSTNGKPSSTSPADDDATKDQSIPEVAKSGPYPRATMEEIEYDFGTMEYGSKGEHTFLIKNEGDAPLKVVVREEDTSCQCTVGKVSDDGLEPGETAEITLNWEIKSPAPTFRHTALVRTNDPEKSTIELAIMGEVANALVTQPDGTWQIGVINDDAPTTANGRIYSSVLDSFNILDVTSNSENVSLTYEPLSEEALEKLNAKCGYELVVTVLPDFPIGPVTGTVSLKTDAKEGITTSVSIRGSKSGPVKVVARGWHADANVLDMGEFPAAEGSSRQMAFFVKSGDPVELIDVQVEPASLKVNWERDESFQGNSQRYILTIEVPPGPPLVRNRSNIAKITLKTSHPEIAGYKVFVSYVAL